MCRSVSERLNESPPVFDELAFQKASCLLVFPQVSNEHSQYRGRFNLLPNSQEYVPHRSHGKGLIFGEKHPQLTDCAFNAAPIRW